MQDVLTAAQEVARLPSQEPAVLALRSRLSALQPAAGLFDPATRTMRGPGGVARLKGQEATVLAALLERPNAYVDYGRLMSRLWGHRPDGGPDTAQTALKVVVCGLRGKLRQVGAPWTVHNSFGCGYSLARIAGGAS